MSADAWCTGMKLEVMRGAAIWESVSYAFISRERAQRRERCLCKSEQCPAQPKSRAQSDRQERPWRGLSKRGEGEEQQDMEWSV